MPSALKSFAASPFTAFRMTDIKCSIDRQKRREAAPDPGLSLFLEVNDNIPAQDSVELALHRPRADQIQLAERHKVAQLVNSAEFCVISPGYRRKPTMAQIRRYRLQSAGRIDACARFGDHIGIDIGGQDFNIVARGIGHERQDGQADRVGLLAIGAGCRPDTDPAAFARGL